MYQAFYRKYRSKTFEEILGQDHIVKALQNQINSKEISHAYLFSGTRGTGKTSTAKIFARAVNCENPKNGNPCNQCPSCRAILEDRVMDVVEMDAASNNGVDDIREIKEKAIYPPQNLKYKVYIIDEVHMLSKGAFNALLKILEEPPAHLIFILATTEPEKIPQTILSRTQRFNFKRIDLKIIGENLKKIAEKENKSCDEEVYRIIASSSDGSMRDALSLLDQCLSLSNQHITKEIANEILGIISEEELYQIVKALIEEDLKTAMNHLDNIYQAGKDIGILTSDLIEAFRNLMIVKTVKNPQELIYTSKIDLLKEIAEKTSIYRIIEILNILNKSLIDVKYSKDKRTILEIAIINIALISKEKDLIGRIEKIEEKINKISIGEIDIRQIPTSPDKKESIIEAEKIEEKPQIVEAVKTEQKAKVEISENTEENMKENIADKIEKKEESAIIEDDLNINIIKSNWNNILIEIRKRNRTSIPILLSSIKAIDYTPNNLIIEFAKEEETQYKMLSNKDNIEFLEDFFKAYYNKEIKVTIKLNTKINKEEGLKKLNDLFGEENITRI